MRRPLLLNALALLANAGFPTCHLPAEVPAKQAVPSHSFSGLGGLVAAAEQASTGGGSAGGTLAGAVGPPPLMACLDSLQPEAQRIVQEAHSGWLSTDQVHKLMANHKALGVPLTEQQPFRPQGAPAASVGTLQRPCWAVSWQAPAIAEAPAVLMHDRSCCPFNLLLRTVKGLAFSAPALLPAAGDLFLADRQLRFDKKDGHSWVDRRSNKLKGAV